ncbi:MAG: pyridoxal phosphate-dependent aminotransferase [Clostridia bacterium]|nr:pyridoxal phosphate-dependent aminotransferase [Clostridia bacterium]
MQHNFDEVVVRRGTDAKKYLHYGPDVLPMWIADTDFKCPQPVVDVCVKRMMEGVYGYPEVSEEYKAAIALWQKKRFGWDVPAACCEFVPGVIPGIICAMRALSHPGDNLAMFTPSYPPFNDMAIHNGRNVLRCELKPVDGHYAIDFDQLEAYLAEERTRLFLLCNPHNPTGRVFTREELTRIGELCLKHHVIVLTDEIHEDIVYKGYRHIPFASISPAFAANSVTFVNASKTFNVAGFRSAAFICTNPDIKGRIHEAVLDNKGIGENLCGTQATIAAYTQCDYYADELVEYLEKNLDLLCETIAKTDKITLLRPEGTYLIWLDCRKMGLSQDELVKFFEEKAKLGLNNGITFGPEGQGHMRINIATSRANMEEAMRRLTAALEAL